jgi:hypothetical protein
MPFIVFMGCILALPSAASQEKSFRPLIVICCFTLEGAEPEISFEPKKSFEEENTPWHTQGGQLAASDAGREIFPAAHRNLLFYYGKRRNVNIV